MGSALQQTRRTAMFLIFFVYAMNTRGTCSPTQTDTFVNRIKRQLANWPFDIETNQLPAGLQSPINIDTSQLQGLDLPPLEYHLFDEMDATDFVKCENDGKSLTCSLNTKTRIPYVSGGPLPGRYVFANTHWHWGKTDKYGSEHNINNKTFPVELHAVFWREDYGDFKTAAIHQDGLCVLAWLGQLSQNDNPNFETLFRDAVTVVPYGSKTIRPWTTAMTFLNKLIKGRNGKPNQNWITYPGALTAPPYWESVTWILYRDPFPISSRQVSLLRNLEKKDGTKNLEHTMQIVPLNGRNVYVRRPNQKITSNQNHKKVVHKRSLSQNEIFTFPPRNLPDILTEPVDYDKRSVEKDFEEFKSKQNFTGGLDLPKNLPDSVRSFDIRRDNVAQDNRRLQDNLTWSPFLNDAVAIVTPPRPNVEAARRVNENVMATFTNNKPT